jgi:hypothetical protein
MLREGNIQAIYWFSEAGYVLGKVDPSGFSRVPFFPQELRKRQSKQKEKSFIIIRMTLQNLILKNQPKLK